MVTRKFLIIAFALASVVCSSCTNEDENTSNSGNSKALYRKLADGTELFITDKGEIIHITDTTVYDADSNEFLDEINERGTIDWYKNPLTRSENNYPQKITVTGFDREQAVGNYVKMAFGKESSIKYGIPQGTYLVSHRAIFKDLAQSEDESIKPRN